MMVILSSPEKVIFEHGGVAFASAERGLWDKKFRRASRVLPVLALKTPRPPSKGGLLCVPSQALIDRINKRIADFH